MSVATKSATKTNVRTTAGFAASVPRTSTRRSVSTALIERPSASQAVPVSYFPQRSRGDPRRTACSSARLPLLPDREPTDHHDEDDQRALDHLRVVLVDTLDDQDRLHEREDEGGGH